MRFFRQEPAKLFWAMAGVCTLLAILAGCVISPRRVVVNGPSPTPTPTGTPTPGTTPAPSPTPTPTPTPMATTVPREFLFLSDAGAPLITVFRINGDGSLAPVPGSPFTIDAPARSLAAIHGMLLVTDEEGMIAYKVDKETGSIQQADAVVSTMAAVDPTSSANVRRSQLAVLDATGRFMYIVDSDLLEIHAFRVEDGKLFKLASRYQLSPKSNAAVIISFSDKADQFAPD